MIYSFLDTSAILNGALDQYKDAYISLLSLTELENIKTAYNKSEQIKYEARKAVRTIIDSEQICYNIYPQKIINKLLKQFNFLTDINDHKIICEAEQLGKEVNSKILFLTSDGAQYLLAQWMPHLEAIFYNPEKKEMEEYPGWKDYSPSEQELTTLYSMPHNNTLESNINEFAKIYENGELKDVLFWTGNEYRNLKYKEFTTNLGERIKPRNLEQKMYLDLLQNKDIPVKLCIGKFGTGKSMLALNYAIHEVQMGRFDKIIFVKNNLEVKGAGKLGTLPGGEIEKMAPWLRQIEDHIGPQAFEEMINNGQIEPAHLSSIRGRDLKNCIILVDEAENLLASNIQLLLGRVAANTEIIFCADVKQCDYADEKMSGIPKLVERLKGNKLFGMIKLVKTERSQVAALADLLD